MNGSELIFFALKQFGDEVGAEQKEEADPKRSGDAKSVIGATGDCKAMKEEDKKEGEEAKDIELWPIKASICCGQRVPRRVDYARGWGVSQGV